MSDRNRWGGGDLFFTQIIKDKETEIKNTLTFVHTTHNLKKLEKNYVNKDLRELYV